MRIRPLPICFPERVCLGEMTLRGVTSSRPWSRRRKREPATEKRTAGELLRLGVVATGLGTRGYGVLRHDSFLVDAVGVGSSAVETTESSESTAAAPDAMRDAPELAKERRFAAAFDDDETESTFLTEEA